jgi:hypothetical protein
MLRAGRMGGVKDTDRVCAFAIANAPCCILVKINASSSKPPSEMVVGPGRHLQRRLIKRQQSLAGGRPTTFANK